MRSKELADFAGVTVRTLRHYHQMGLLPEPPRSANGYRAYRASDMARVLRIKRMTALGMSLQQVKELFDREGADAGASFSETLDALDAELAEEIERLEEKRRIVAALRERNLDPDVPPAFGEHVARLRDAGASSHLVDLERSGLLLVDRFFVPGSEEAEAVARFFELIDETDSTQTYIALNERMLALPPDSSDDELRALAAEFVNLMVPLLELGRRRFGWELSVEEVSELFTSSGSAASLRETMGKESFSSSFGATEETQDLDVLLEMYDRETLNAAQIRMNDYVVKGILDALAK